MSNKNAQVLVGGDFSCGNIEWSIMQIPEGVPNRRVQSQLLEIAQEHCLSQVVNTQEAILQIRSLRDKRIYSQVDQLVAL